MAILLALIPIMMIFVCLFVFKQTSLKASLFSYAVCVGIVLFTPMFRLGIGETVHATIKGGLICFIVGYVLFFGIFLFHLMNKMGYINQVARFMEQVTHDRLLQMLLMCFGICPLIESVSGFGIGFMVAAPIFLSLGYKPFQAVLLSFIGLLASSWGAMATGTIIGSQLINMSLTNLGSSTALLSIPIFAYFVILSLHVVGGWQAVKKKWKEGFGFFLLFSVSIYLSNTYVSVELAGILSSIVTITYGFLIIKMTARQGKEFLSEHAATVEREVSIMKIISPYLFLTVCILLSRLIPSLHDILRSYAVLDLKSYSYKLELLYSPGFWLGITCLFTILFFRIPSSIIKESISQTIKQWIPFAITTTMFIAISELMGAAGMHTLLAEAAGQTFGTLFVFVAPFIGGVGGFLTGSNAGSNAMFIKLQMQTAQNVGLPWQYVTTLQNTASSVATIACPSRITLGAYLCNIPFRENELLKKTTLMIFGAVLIVVVEVVGWYVLQ
ncbi:lactate permease [Bacillus pseudomycoides]|uniref:L-lactate permease n=1 Tax=Bacillus pseudomycoides TaxID=64104 RepID=A0AA91V9W0_9BACI|nr:MULTISPECIES: L-lactate permease [Bacillus]PEB52854.1 lactate permease [Bacillus sp. AFS098217]PED80748.1 lactate permease [Bacillus pseudomycoides]PEU08077.1 lactate permease [Bacillus sp. AFS019443]PEU16622.1 lactate permease [Bacillus sp. AFS014408]PFW64206.1 lactate permease [Bacillus sp. AFS075034]